MMLDHSRTLIGQVFHQTATFSGTGETIAVNPLSPLVCQLWQFVCDCKQHPALWEDGGEGSKGIHGRLQP